MAHPAVLNDLQTVDVTDAEVNDQQFRFDAFQGIDAFTAGLIQENFVAHLFNELTHQL